MRYRPPRNKWGADFAEDYERNLEDIERDITGVEEVVEGSKVDAEQALTFATEAKGKAESVQAQFNQVVIEGDSSVEAAQARVDAENVSHPTLKARADSDYNKVTAQLAESVKYVNVKKYGAKGDNTTDDTTSILDAIEECKNLRNGNKKPVLFFPDAIGYKTTASIVVPKDISVIMDGRINYAGTDNVVILSIGDEGAGSSYRTVSADYKLSVHRNNVSDWTDEANIGIKLINIQTSDIEIVHANRNTIGVQFLGAGSGFVYNNVRLRYLTENKIAVDVANKSVGSTVGWSNENLFLGGQFACFSNTNIGKSRYGVRMKSLDGTYSGNNGNLFVKPSFELNQTSAGAGEALPILLIDSISNQFIGCRNEGNGNILARYEKDAKDNLVEVGYGNAISTDISRLKTNITKSKELNFVGSAKPFLTLEGLHKRYNYYNDSSIHINGVDFISSSNGSYLASSDSLILNTTNIGLSSVGGLKAPGLFLDTSKNKRFVIQRDCLDGQYGRILLKLYKNDGTLITASDNDVKLYAVANGFGVQTGFTWTTSFGGALNQSNDLDYSHFILTVNDDVDYIFLAFNNGTSGLAMRGFSISTPSGNPVNSWTNFSLPSGDGIATKAPIKGKYSLYRKIYNAAPSGGGKMGWVCTTAGTANSTAWVASTAYTVGKQVNVNNNVYECTVAGTSGTTAPSHTSGEAVDGTVTWKYIDLLAIFKGFGTIDA